MHTITQPWYDAVDALPSGAHVHGWLEALEWKNPALHDSLHLSGVLPVCLPGSGHSSDTTEFAGSCVGFEHVSSLHAVCGPLASAPVAATPK